MKYEELKKFILEEMRMEDNHNYQPVMIRTLNQNDGKATKGEIINELHYVNPGLKENFFDNHIVFNVLTESHPVAKFDETDKKYHLLDYETYNPAEKAWITNYCNEKISGQAEKKYFVLEDEKEIEIAQNTLLTNLRNHVSKQGEIIIGFPGPAEKVTGNVEYISQANMWWYSRKLTDQATPRHWNCFSLGEPNWGKNNSIVLEINPPIKGISRRVAGAFVKDQNGFVYLAHDGKLGGGNTPSGFYDVYPHDERWVRADDGKEDPRDLILISEVNSSKLPEFIADYVQNVAKYKSGELISKKASFYLLLRHKAEDNPYQDDLGGKVYHFSKIPNYKTVFHGDTAICLDRQDREYYF